MPRNSGNPYHALAEQGRVHRVSFDLYQPAEYARQQQSLHTEHPPTTHITANCPFKHPAADPWHLSIQAFMAGTMATDVSSQMGIPYSKQIDNFV